MFDLSIAFPSNSEQPTGTDIMKMIKTGPGSKEQVGDTIESIMAALQVEQAAVQAILAQPGATSNRSNKARIEYHLERAADLKQALFELKSKLN